MNIVRKWLACGVDWGRPQTVRIKWAWAGSMHLGSLRHWRLYLAPISVGLAWKRCQQGESA